VQLNELSVVCSSTIYLWCAAQRCICGVQLNDVSVVCSIHHKWGDYLYGKGDYDAAMSQYLETMGRLEASYVIRRFLDAQRIHNLTTYLEQLHERVGVGPTALDPRLLMEPSYWTCILDAELG
jgi:hypothetical protein